MSEHGIILIVDDTLASLKLLADTLKAEGYTVRAAQSGELALRAAALNPPELILLDIRMPGIDGYETCRRLKADPTTRDIPVIFLSAGGASEDKVQGFALGAVDYITKPFQHEELFARVRTHLLLHRLSSRLEAEIEARTRELGASEARLRTMIERAPEAILLFDVDQDCIVQVNSKVEQLSGLPRAALLGHSPAVMYAPEQPGQRSLGETIEEHVQRALAGEEVVFERLVRTPGGADIPVEVRLVAMPPDDRRLLRASLINISERKAAAAQLDYLAHYDTLTGLPNQISLRKQLAQVTEDSTAGAQRHAVMMIDLDNFRYINDIRGHHYGDLLLIQVANRLKELARGRGFVTRQSGDEFVAVFTQLDQQADIAALAEEILRSLTVPYLIHGLEVACTASIGICVYPDDAADHTELIQHCDLALDHAKSIGKGRYQFHDAGMDAALLQRLTLESELRTALEHEQLVLHYQPKVELASGRVVGLEALIRWQHPQKGMVPPASFIPVAEQTGLIPQIDRWVLRRACHQLKAWQQAGMEAVSVSVNISASHFEDDNLIQYIQSLLAATGLPASRLDLEITESSAMSSPDKAIALMRKLVQLGVTISIDDFGTGYSSLSYLKQFPIHTLKIDRSFVTDVCHDSNDAVLCEIIIYLAHRMGLNVVAEGVETVEQLRYLSSIACNTVQGYLFSKPLPADQVQAFVTSHLPRQYQAPLLP
ncbi:EAL domain-containing protein [Chitinivorax sp. PXF-14]|uniref:putative bifunctional diguanylate cyclase/phosphodiesterase n=1 Tax=Chitinivorax sp. PXF-14 TaxID=3230488 RepID=UPI0034668A55